MPFIVEECADGLHKWGWIAESQSKPADRKLWLRARMLAQADKDYSAVTSRVIALRLYRMLGGTFVPKKKSSRKKKVLRK